MPLKALKREIQCRKCTPLYKKGIKETKNKSMETTQLDTNCVDEIDPWKTGLRFTKLLDGFLGNKVFRHNREKIAEK